MQLVFDRLVLLQYPVHESQVAQIKDLTYGTWDSFKAELYRDLFGDERYRPRQYVFRGQRDSDWHLESSFDRWYSTWGHGHDRIALAKQFVVQFIEACEEQGLEVDSDPESMGCLALAQHHGAPTRLLDWTDSPYIAAFFAFDAHIASSSPRNDATIAIWALPTQAPIWRKETGVELVRPPRLASVRARNQFGLFTMARTPFRTLEEYVKAHEWPGVGLVKIIMPASCAASAISDLTAMGLSPGRLFWGYDGAAATARQRMILL